MGNQRQVLAIVSFINQAIGGGISPCFAGKPNNLTVFVFCFVFCFSFHYSTFCSLHKTIQTKNNTQSTKFNLAVQNKESSIFCYCDRMILEAKSSAFCGFPSNPHSSLASLRFAAVWFPFSYSLLVCLFWKFKARLERKTVYKVKIWMWFS